jgi:hypothetical protein
VQWAARIRDYLVFIFLAFAKGVNYKNYQSRRPLPGGDGRF